MNTTPEILHYKNKLVASIQLLALPYENQREMLPAFVDLPFELLDVFDSAFILLPQIVEAELLSYQEISWVLRLNNQVSTVHNMIELHDLDEGDHLNHEVWQLLRNLAGQVLDKMSIHQAVPNPDLV